MQLLFSIISISMLLSPNYASESDSSVHQAKGFFSFLFKPCKCRCGISNREARLIGGEYLRGYEFPWMALIQTKGRSVPGTLINDRYIITAASPMIGLTPFEVKITIGQFDRCFPDVSSLNASVETIIVHQEFNPGNRAHDIALLRLSHTVNFEKRILPICLSTPGATYLGQVATFIGWSASTGFDYDKSRSCRPRKLGLPVLEYTECLGTASKPQFLSVDKGCAGVVGSRNVICKSDTGGPVMYRSYGGVYELIGIISDGNECNSEPSTALYTTLNDHLHWITDHTVDACFCVKTLGHF